MLLLQFAHENFLSTITHPKEYSLEYTVYQIHNKSKKSSSVCPETCISLYHIFALASLQASLSGCLVMVEILIEGVCQL